MFVEMNPSNGGGGGSAKSGTTSATSISQEIAIDTGLQSVSQFVWFAMNNNNNAMQIIAYDVNIGNVFTTAFPATNAGYVKRNIGSAATSSNPSLLSISGGTVTIKMASGNGYGNCQAGYWFAQ